MDRVKEVAGHVGGKDGLGCWGGRGGVRGWAGGGVAGRILDAELGSGPDGVGGVFPQLGVVVERFRGVEDTAVGGFVEELQGGVLALSDLVAEVDAGVLHEDVFGSRRQDFEGGAVEYSRDREIGIQVHGGVKLGASTAARSLHRPGFWAAPCYYCPYASFVMH